MSPLHRSVCGISQPHSKFRFEVIFGHFQTSLESGLTTADLFSIFRFLGSIFLYSFGIAGVGLCITVSFTVASSPLSGSTTLAESSSAMTTPFKELLISSLVFWEAFRVGKVDNCFLVLFKFVIGSAAESFSRKSSGNVVCETTICIKITATRITLNT